MIDQVTWEVGPVTEDGGSAAGESPAFAGRVLVVSVKQIGSSVTVSNSGVTVSDPYGQQLLWIEEWDRGGKHVFPRRQVQSFDGFPLAHGDGTPLVETVPVLGSVWAEIVNANVGARMRVTIAYEY